MTLLRRRRAAIIVVATSVALAGCGGGGGGPAGVTPAAYVKARCITLTAWKSAVQRAGTRLQAARPKTLVEGKQNYVKFVAELVAATTHAERAMRAAGTPSVTNGSQIARALVGAFDTAGRQLRLAARRAARIPIKDTSVYAKAVGGLTTSISAMLSKMGSISPGSSPQLQAAASRSPACKPLVS